MSNNITIKTNVKSEDKIKICELIWKEIIEDNSNNYKEYEKKAFIDWYNECIATDLGKK